MLEAQVWAPEYKNILTLLGAMYQHSLLILYNNRTVTTLLFFKHTGVLYNVSLDYDGAVRSFHRALVDDPNDFPLLNKVYHTSTSISFLVILLLLVVVSS